MSETWCTVYFHTRWYFLFRYVMGLIVMIILLKEYKQPIVQQITEKKTME